ncbi:alpha-amylase family glycosyl hydrolase [Fusibacter sp. 3D3]|uniref:alpha-amylase family glycosyl hydrolase n=1 Tax=Fusibacter sp. 3D3 TaxID=1048380 RepID=UPI0015862B25|nr:alpha-amylase family glycosyl hydrolase [Fusibacter sp. 3D3]
MGYLEALKRKYDILYPECEAAFNDLMHMMQASFMARNDIYIEKDSGATDWIASGETVGMMLYVDLFSENLKHLKTHVDHFSNLGISLIHLMPILMPREGENDGGYAVKNYRAIDPRVGNLEDFKAVVSEFHQKGIKICLDYVINHTANDHEWAVKALMGEEKYQDYYLMYDDSAIPNAFESALGEVFPTIAPGNFTFNEDIQKYVMTTFYPYQWDLNYKNPRVFHEMVSNLLFLANIGVDMIRLDAIPYIWKTLGTDCRNLPEVHVILSLFRDIISVCAPSTALLGEAIVSPNVIVRYFGKEERLECHSLYNASYMVEIWNSIATRDARHMALMPQYDLPQKSVWINYARCHDDIGWGLDESKIRNLGFEPQAHKNFLIDFYLGSLDGSFSIGELYEYNPEKQDARNSGTLASLAGLEKAIESSDRYQVELAHKRILLIHALILLRKGIPMLYAGDEMGQLNDYAYKHDPKKMKDSRWLHRGRFDWSKSSPVFDAIKELIDFRKKAYGQKYIVEDQPLLIGNQHVLLIQQIIKEESEDYLLLFNMTEDRQWVYTTDLKRYGYHGVWIDLLQGKQLSFEEEKILLGPYEFLVIQKNILKK